MTEHEPFLAAIEADPADDTHRLVYADWLDERDHRGGEYLRVERRLAEIPPDDLVPALRDLRRDIDADWLARID